MANHRCVFQSEYGFIPGRRKLALMCACGRWGMPAGGEWRIVPKELLPNPCRTITWFHRLLQGLGSGYTVVLLILLALALL